MIKNDMRLKGWRNFKVTVPYFQRLQKLKKKLYLKNIFYKV